MGSANFINRIGFIPEIFLFYDGSTKPNFAAELGYAEPAALQYVGRHKIATTIGAQYVWELHDKIQCCLQTFVKDSSSKFVC